MMRTALKCRLQAGAARSEGTIPQGVVIETG